MAGQPARLMHELQINREISRDKVGASIGGRGRQFSVSLRPQSEFRNSQDYKERPCLKIKKKKKKAQNKQTKKKLKKRN